MYKQNCFKFQPIAEVWVSWDHQKVRNLWNHSADLLNMDLFYVRVKTCQTFPGVEYGLHALNLPIIISLFDRFVAKMPLVPISIDRLMLSMKSGGYAVYLPLIHTSMYGHFTGFTNNLWRSLFRKQRDSASRDIGGNRIGHVQLRPVAKSWVYPSKTSDGAPKHNRHFLELISITSPHRKTYFFCKYQGQLENFTGYTSSFFASKPWFLWFLLPNHQKPMGVLIQTVQVTSIEVLKDHTLHGAWDAHLIPQQCQGRQLDMGI